MSIPDASINQFVDLTVIVCANIFNLMMVAIFLLRARGSPGSGLIYVIIEFVMVIILAYGAIHNWINDRGLWLILLPALMFIFLISEILLDYVLKIPFRESRLLGPYLLLYYSAQMGLIGYAFMIDRIYGFITLITYFLSLGATGYSYSKVGHGKI